MDKFEWRKKQQLAKRDRSTAGSLDEKMQSLCNKINKNLDYYTTSSCSGRIVLIRDSLKKKKNLFIFRSHKLVSPEEIFKILKKIEQDDGEKEGIILFKQEPCILVVACRNIIAAAKMINLGREKAGWKNSGIMSLKRNICELKSTENLALPVIKNRKIIISEDYLKIVVSEANSRLRATWKKIDRLEKLI